MQFNSWKWEGSSSLLPGNSSQPPAACPRDQGFRALCSDSSSPFFQAQTDARRLLQSRVTSNSSEHWQELHLIKTLFLSLTVSLYCVIQLGGFYCFELMRTVKKHHGLLLRGPFTVSNEYQFSPSCLGETAPTQVMSQQLHLSSWCSYNSWWGVVEHIVWAYICSYCFAAIFFSSSCHPWIYSYFL